jgi:hypothetical protein
MNDFQLTCTANLEAIAVFYFIIVTDCDTIISMAAVQNSQVGKRLTPFSVWS